MMLCNCLSYETFGGNHLSEVCYVKGRTKEDMERDPEEGPCYCQYCSGMFS